VELRLSAPTNQSRQRPQPSDAGSTLALLIACAAILGCAGMPVVAPSNNATASTGGSALQGKVHGGQNPVAGAHVYLYAVNVTGYAGPGIPASSSNAAQSLLTTGSGTDSLGTYVTTDSGGNFTLTSFTCPTATPDVYVLSVGGNSGSGNNPAIALVAGLGEPCSSSGFSSLYVVVNEVSTVAAAFAGAGFATDAMHVSTSGSTLAKQGAEDAYAAILNLESVGTGVANSVTYGGNGTVPQAEVNTLANIVAACVNSTGSTSSACTTLFNNALSGGTTGTAPTDTTTAAMNIAHNPGANVENLFALQGGSPPFVPDLSAAPNDFTIAITYTGGGLNSPWGLAIDGKNYVWTTDGSNDISKFNGIGVPVSGSTGFTGGGLINSLGIAINTDNNPWVTNGGGNPARISNFSSNGTAISGSGGYTGGGVGNSQAIALDASGNVWIANTILSTLSEFSIAGTPNASSPFTGGGLDQPEAIAIDVSGNIWCVNNSGNSISKFNSSGVANGSSPFTGGGLASPQGIAIDAAGNIWVANSGSSNGISEFNSSGVPYSGSPFSSGDVNGETTAIAIDGNGNVWATGQSSFLEYSSSGSPITGSNGYQPGLYHLQGIAIDGSGNVWATSYGGGTLTELVGAAVPVVTPILANLLSPYGSHAVNRP